MTATLAAPVGACRGREVTWPLAQPIATAPRDGTEYLATDGERRWVENCPPGHVPGEWSRYGDEKTGPWFGFAHTAQKQARFWWPLPPINETEIAAVKYSEDLPW